MWFGNEFWRQMTFLPVLHGKSGRAGGFFYPRTDFTIAAASRTFAVISSH